MVDFYGLAGRAYTATMALIFWTVWYATHRASIQDGQKLTSKPEAYSSKSQDRNTVKEWPDPGQGLKTRKGRGGQYQAEGGCMGC